MANVIKKIGINILITISAIIICLFLLELILRTGVFDQEDNPHPTWIPHKFQKIHREINRKNWAYAKLNPYRFTDRIREYKKEKGVKRIAVLGDSFVWGYGIPYEEAWSHKLENLIASRYKNIEVLHWGFGAWSTMDEISFFEKEGIKYDIDMLIIGFVNNDPDIGEIELRELRWHKTIPIKLLKIIFPNAIAFIRSHVNHFLFRFLKDYGYKNWVNKLYSEENLKKYSELLKDFFIFCNARNIKLLFVLTPSNYDDIYKKQFERIIPLLKHAHIKYLNLYPSVKAQLGHINPRRLWANPADGHPGTLMTDVFAEEVFNYLEREGIFSQEKDLYQEFAKKGINELTFKTLVNTALRSDNWDMRKQAAIILSTINNPYITDILIKEALYNEKPEIRESAVDVLGELKDPKVVDILLAALNDKHRDVRKRAILSIEKTGSKEPRIIKHLSILVTTDKDKYVRRRAILALTKFNDPQAIEAITDALKDEFFLNRKSAAIALKEAKDPTSVEPLIALLDDNIKDVRIEAVEALGEIRDPRAIEPLKKVALHDRDSLIRDVAADALKKITGEDFARFRRKLLRVWQSL